MARKMLIDAAHTEEVRVCVLEHGKVEDFDFESSARKPLRGNIYLARVTRVEPSLQAAFVEYGGNRHGFLAFSEIHPDYYQIPVSDRRLLQQAEAEEAALASQLELEQRGDFETDEIDADDDTGRLNAGTVDDENGADDDDRAKPADRREAASSDDDNGSADEDEDARRTEGGLDEEEEEEEVGEDDEPVEDAQAADDDEAEIDEGSAPRFKRADSDEAEASGEDDEADDADKNGEGVEDGAEEAPVAAGKNGRQSRQALLEQYREARRKRARILRNYKIQEVIKRRQILLVQVVKEERGNKGAALTTYMSLAGRYCVLMPNTARGGGISRKIPNASDRKRLRRVVDGLDVPTGMGLIIRTAGAKRTKAEIKRDYDYLIRLWENIRALTLKSIAPCLIYEEASLIKRAIRDLYDKDISEVLVEGEAGYREAKDFMKMLMPSHAKNIQPYKDKTPLFLKMGAESQLDAMYQPVVRLRSGGYLVIHQTEALIAIDVNSGKSTRERNIELTALKTNLEAAREAARQFRLRDLAGLIVLDFIDMEENRNNRAVEKALKDALKNDRARIQVGRISNFGLLEMSRQRRRSGIIDGTTVACPTCAGSGAVRSHEMAALRILRGIEGEALGGKASVLKVKTSLDVALYILNHKRAWLRRIEKDYAVTVEIEADAAKAGDLYEIEKSGAPRPPVESAAFVRADTVDAADGDAPAAVVVDDDAAAETALGDAEAGDAQPRKRRRRRRKRRDDRGDGDSQSQEASDRDEEAGEDEDGEESRADSAGEGEDGADGGRKRRRRGRRGGKRNRKPRDGESENASDTKSSDGSDAEEAVAEAPAADDADAANDKSAEAERPAPPLEDDAPVNGAGPEEKFDQQEDAATAAADEPADVAAAEDEQEPAAAYEPPAENVAEPARKPRKGWWQRAVGG